MCLPVHRNPAYMGSAAYIAIYIVPQGVLKYTVHYTRYGKWYYMWSWMTSYNNYVHACVSIVHCPWKKQGEWLNV